MGSGEKSIYPAMSSRQLENVTTNSEKLGRLSGVRSQHLVTAAQLEGISIVDNLKVIGVVYHSFQNVLNTAGQDILNPKNTLESFQEPMIIGKWNKQ